MIDLKLLRDEPDAFRAAYARRGGVETLDDVLDLNRRYRDLLAEVEELRAEQNRASKAIGQAPAEERQTAIDNAKKLADRLKELEPGLEAAGNQLNEAAAFLPNLPHPSVPEGLTEDDNVVEREVGDK